MPPSDTPPTRLVASRIPATGPEYDALLAWPYPDAPFYERQVGRALRADIPKYLARDAGTLFAFHDPALGAEAIGFGALCFSSLYLPVAGGRAHLYIPLLSLDPGRAELRGRGYGKEIVNYLVAEAHLRWREAQNATLAPLVFLEVYCANDARILYTKCGFSILNEDRPTPDPEENNEPYYVMARSLAVEASAPPG